MSDTPKVKIGDKDYGLRVQTLSLLKDLAPLRKEYQQHAAGLDRIDAEMTGLLSRMAAFADGSTPEGEESTLAQLQEQQAALGAERDDVSLLQFETRLSLVYQSIADPPDEEAFMAAVGVNELAGIEEVINDARPTSTSGG